MPCNLQSKDPLNAFLYDFWRGRRSGLSEYKSLLKVNKINENDCWANLKRFSLALKSVYKCLERR